METGVEPAPSDLFRHVEKSETLNFEVNQFVEVDLSILSKKLCKEITKGFYFWPCEIVCVTPVTLNLRFIKLSEVNGEHSNIGKNALEYPPFWIIINDTFWELVHPVGWAESQSKPWLHPSFLDPAKRSSEISRSFPYISEDFAQKMIVSSVPRFVFAKRAVFLHENVRVGDYLECKPLSDPSTAWPVQILKKYGGRLVVTWFGISVKYLGDRGSYVCQNTSDNLGVDDPIFSIFMWDPRIRSLGWSLSHSFPYKPPSGLAIPAIDINADFISSLSQFGSVMPWKTLFVFAPEPPKHAFTVGKKLEAFNNSQPEGGRPATVVRILSDRYFVVRFDVLPGSNSVGLPEPQEFIAHVGMPQIMPPKMCEYYGLKLLPPVNWPSGKFFNWSHYVTFLFHLSNTPSSGLAPYLTLTNASYQSLMKYLATPVDRFFNTSAPKSKNPQDFQLDNYSPLRIVGVHGPARLKRLKMEPTDSAGLWTSRDFCPGMKLEMALLNCMWSHTKVTERGELEFHESPICTATVIRCQAGMLWLLPDLLPDWSPHANPQYTPNMPIVIETSSASIYPLGWSLSNNHPFIPPASYLCPLPLSVDDSPIWRNPPMSGLNIPQISGIVDVGSIYTNSEVCPPIYLNTSCYTGPHILPGKFESLPRVFGPGPTERTLVSLLYRLSVAIDKSIRVLRGLDADWVDKLANAAITGNVKRHKEALTEAVRRWHSEMRLTSVSVRCPRKGVSVSLPFEVCKRARAVGEFLLQVCIGLEACPFLMSTHEMDRSKPCPLRCHQLIKSHRLGNDHPPPPMVLITHDTIVSTACLLNNELRISKGTSRRPLVISSRLLTSRSLLPPLLYDWSPSSHPSSFADANKTNASGDTGEPRPPKRPRMGSGRKVPQRNGNDRAAVSRLDQGDEINLPHNGDASNFQNPEVPTLISNPLKWSAVELETYLNSNDCHDLSPFLASQDVDGHSFLLFPSAQELHLQAGLKWDLAVKISQHANRVRSAYQKQFENRNS